MKNAAVRVIYLLSMGLLCATIFLRANSISDAELRPTVQQQDTLNYYVEMFGSIRQMKDVMSDSGDNPWLDSATVTVYCNDAVYTKVLTTRRGKCTFQLPLNRTYIVELSKPGFVSKRFEVNTKTPPNKKDVYEFYFDMNLFASIEGLDTKVLDKPIAIVYYNITNNQFEYDPGYTNKINNDIKLLYRNYYILEHSHKKKKK